MSKPLPSADPVQALMGALLRLVAKEEPFRLEVELAGRKVTVAIVDASARPNLPAESTAHPKPQAGCAFEMPVDSNLMLSKVQRMILATARLNRDKLPWPRKKLIVASNYALNTYSRTAVSLLVKDGFLQMVFDGVVLGPRADEK